MKYKLNDSWSFFVLKRNTIELEKIKLVIFILLFYIKKNIFFNYNTIENISMI